MRKLIALVVAMGLTVGAAHAALTPNSGVSVQTPQLGLTVFVGGTDTAGTYKTLYTAGSNGSKCVAVTMTNNDGSATHLVTLQVVRSGTQYGGAAVQTINNAGFASGSPPQSFLTSGTWNGLPLDTNGNPFLILGPSDTLQATFATALTGTTQINLMAICGDY